MSKFVVVLIESGYPTSQYERDIVSKAGGEFIDAQDRPTEESLKLCQEAEGILVRRIDVTAEMIRSFRKCKIIVRYGVGSDNVDIQAATEAGIVVGNVPDYCIDEVSSHAVALLLCCIRDVAATHQRMARGSWDVRRPIAVHRMAGKTLGLVGLGQIGQAVARKLTGWHMDMLATDPFVSEKTAAGLGVELVDLATVCRRSDYISVHVPLLPETRHLIGLCQFELTKPGAILVNTSRGPVVDTQALLAALQDGKLARAGLDVFESEPLESDSLLRSSSAVVLTDHMAWYSEESQAQLQSSAAEAIVTVCRGKLPSSLANPEVIQHMGRLEEWQPAESMRWRLKRLGWNLEQQLVFPEDYIRA
jgi:D-3-phosphoglycerate dehydrogenase